jgi:drug/metabolite transporter (DMT)-like permease
VTAGLGRIYALILVTTVLWGGTAVAGKLVIQDVRPFTAGVLRYGLSSLLLLAIFWRRLPDPRRLGRGTLGLLVLVGILGTFVNHACFFSALIFAPATHGALIPSPASALSTNLVAARVEGRRLPSAFIAGMVLCVAGVVLVVRPERLLAGIEPLTLVGDVLFLIGGACWGVYSYLSKVVMERLSAAATLTYGICVGTVLLVPVALAERPWGSLGTAPPAAWVAVGYLAVAATVLAFLWWNVAIRRVGAGRTAVFTNLVPLWGVLLAWLVLGERLTPGQLVGGLLAVVGVLLCQGPAAWTLLARAGRSAARGRAAAGVQGSSRP